MDECAYRPFLVADQSSCVGARRKVRGCSRSPSSLRRARVGRAATASGYLLSPALLGGRRSGATIMQAPMQGTMQTAPGAMTMVRARVRVRVSGHGFAVRTRERASEGQS